MKRSMFAIGGCLAALAVAATAQEARPKTEVRIFSGELSSLTRTKPTPGLRSVYVVDASPGEQDFAHEVDTALRDWQAAGTDDVRDDVKQRLRSTLEDIFAARQQDHEQEIQQLEEKVKQLREQLEKRKEKQQEIIDFRLEQLLREAEGLGWGGDDRSRSGDPFAARVPGMFAPARVAPSPSPFKALPDPVETLPGPIDSSR